MSAHHLLGPSAAPKWMRCPGAIKAEQHMAALYGPHISGVEASEGTAAHMLLERCLKNGTQPSDYLGDVIKIRRDDSAPCDFLVDDEVIDHLDWVVNSIRDEHDDICSEWRVDLSRWIPNGFGTLDIGGSKDDTIFVEDLKWGLGVAHAREQLQIYGLGVFNAFGLPERIKRFRFRIYQPRIFYGDKLVEWELPTAEVLQFGKRVKKVATLALQPDAPRVPGEVQCRYCRFAPRCPQLAQHMTGLVGTDTTLRPVDHLGTDQVVELLEAADSVRHWLNNLEAHATARMKAGEAFPGFKLVASRTKRQWRDDQAAAFILQWLIDPDQIYETKMLSPSAIEKRLPKALRTQVSSLVSRAQGEVVLAPASDRRPPVTDPGAALADLGED